MNWCIVFNDRVCVRRRRASGWPMATGVLVVYGERGGTAKKLTD